MLVSEKNELYHWYSGAQSTSVAMGKKKQTKKFLAKGKVDFPTICTGPLSPSPNVQHTEIHTPYAHKG